MTEYTFAELDQWVRKTQRRMDIVVKQSAHDAFRMASRTATGVTRGGSVQPGFVPRDTGFLAAGAVSSLNGSTSLSGADAYVLTTGGMKAGDEVMMGWTAEYARKVHYDGWMWVDVTANAWPKIVERAIQRAKLQVGG